MGVLFEAIDTLFFKDGKPFSMGAESWADGIFPPNPGTLYGSIRTNMLSAHPDGFTVADTDADTTKQLKITGISYFVANSAHFPLPLDCVRRKDNPGDNVDEVFNLVLNKKEKMCSSYAFPHYLAPPEQQKVESISDGLITTESLVDYLETGKLQIVCERMSEFITREPKVGIGRMNSTRTTDKGKLYRVGMVRLEGNKGRGVSAPKKMKILVNLNQQVALPAQFAKLGGEGKLTTNTNTTFPEIATVKSDSQYIKIYLSTAAIFHQGAIPSFADHPLLKEFDIEIMAAVTGKPNYVGGFDMKNKKPKVMMRSVPAGSVYYIHCKQGAAALAEKIHGNSISDFCSSEGYGIAYVGVFQNA